jgi:hypothetical protein|tara:strand:- start:9413 stop:9709 length:297 start_codon:yes stop_codon:yes gene_type:complete
MPGRQEDTTHARRTYVRGEAESPDDSRRNTCDGGQTMADEFSRLKLLLEAMDVPEMRRDVTKVANVRWLLRNLAINNSNNTALREVFRLLKDIARAKK